MFELHLTCSKDIKELHLDFMDGTTCTSKCEVKNENINENIDDKPIDMCESQSTYEVPEKPIIPDISNRDIKIDPILTDLQL